MRSDGRTFTSACSTVKERINIILLVTEAPGTFSGTVYFVCARTPVLPSAPESFWRVPLFLLLLSHWSAESLNDKWKETSIPNVPLLCCCFYWSTFQFSLLQQSL